MDAYLRLLNRVGVLQASPLWEAMTPAAQRALQDRVGALAEVEGGGFDNLDASDATLIRKGELQVSAGASSRFTDPSTWGDWTAIDAALEAGDMAALDAELEKVGPLDGGDGGSADGGSESKADTLDLEGDWVGL